MKDEYRQVRFRCDSAEVPTSFFIVTAHNPDGVTCGDLENQKADARLRTRLDSLGHDYFPVTGGSADLSHAEPGCGLGCSREAALDLAREFQQEAVFEIRDGIVFLVSALPQPGPDEALGRWDELILR